MPKRDHLTPEERAAFAKRAAARAEVIPPRSARLGSRHSSGDGRTRRRSGRYYLNQIDDYRAAVDAGMISSADGSRRVQMARLAAETFFVTQEMELRGMGEAADVTPHPEEGYQPPQLLPHRVKRVAVKSGVGRHGEAIDEKTVTIESNHSGDDPEPDAEIEALT